jgi:hypothetical protein
VDRCEVLLSVAVNERTVRPVSLGPGVQVNCPVVWLKLASGGTMEERPIESLSDSDALTLKANCVPVLILVD